MIQEISPHLYNVEFCEKQPLDSDILLIFRRQSILMDMSSSEPRHTTVGEIRKICEDFENDIIHLFTIDNTSVFCSFQSFDENDNLRYIAPMDLRDKVKNWGIFIAATASHFANWYDTNKFCGRCSSPMTLSHKERALCCEKCGLVVYPHISPAVIVGIVNKDKILLTRYADRPYKKLSLVAGFVEIGETLEDTISREVMEEVGLLVKNIKYYKSQPWSFSQSLLTGFFVELDGSDFVQVDGLELSEANWYSRDQIPECDSNLSLTNDMIEAFRQNKLEYKKIFNT